MREQIPFVILSISAPIRMWRLSMCTVNWALSSGCGGSEVMDSLDLSMEAAAVTDISQESAYSWLISVIWGMMWGFMVYVSVGWWLSVYVSFARRRSCCVISVYRAEVFRWIALRERGVGDGGSSWDMCAISVRGGCVVLSWE